MEDIKPKISVLNDNIIVDNIPLDSFDLNSIEVQINNDLEDADNDKQALVNRVIEYRQIINMEPNSDNEMSSIEGASNYRDQLSASHCKVISSIIKRTLLTKPVYIVDIPFNKQYERWLNESMDDYISYMGIDDKFRKLIDLCVSEGVAFVEVIDYADRNQVINNEVYFKGEMEKFKTKYPNYKIIGLPNQKAYTDLVNEMVNKIDTDGYAKISVEQQIYDHKVDIEIRNIDEVYIMPNNSTDINNAKGIFSRVVKSIDELQKAAEIGYFDKEAVKQTIESDKANRLSDVSTYRDTEEVRLGTESTVDDYFYDIYTGVYMCDLGDGIKEYNVYFARKAKKILRIEPYIRTINSRTIIPFSINKEHNQIIGRSIVALLKNAQDLVDTYFNQITDNNHIANIPMYIADMEELTTQGSALQGTYGSSKLKFEPGAVHPLKNPGGFREMQNTPINIPALFNVINLIQRNSEVYTGATQGLSGRENPADPSAPALKTQIQLAQSTLRIDDYLKELQESFNTVGKLLLFKLLNIEPRRWKNYRMQFKNENPIDPSVVVPGNVIDNVALRPQDIFITPTDELSEYIQHNTFDDVIIYTRGQSVAMNKDSIIRDAQFLMQTLLPLPIINQNPQSVAKLTEKFMEAFGMTRREIAELIGSTSQNLTTSSIMQQAQATAPPEIPAQLRQAMEAQGIQLEKPIEEQQQAEG